METSKIDQYHVDVYSPVQYAVLNFLERYLLNQTWLPYRLTVKINVVHLLEKIDKMHKFVCQGKVGVLKCGLS